MKTGLLLLPVLLSQMSCSDFPPPREPFTLSWTGGLFVWPSAVVRSMYKSSGKFRPENVIATRAAIFRDEVYVAFPRYLPGVPATLAKCPLLCPNCEPVFEPFPGWDNQMEGDCSCLQNVVDMFRDQQDVLWLLDTGIVHTLDRPVKHCGPKAVGIDLRIGKQVFNVDLSDLTTKSSRLQYIVSDMDTRDRRFLYISDAGNRAVLVYNIAEDCGYRVELPESVLCGCTSACGDVLYMALAKPRSGGRQLYLTYLCGDGLYTVRTEDLRAGTHNGTVDLVPGGKPQRMIIIGSDNRCTIYFRYEGKGDVYAWDVNDEFVQDKIKLVHSGDCCLLATHAVLDSVRGKIRLLQSNFLDFLRRSVGMGAVHVLRAIT